MYHRIGEIAGRSLALASAGAIVLLTIVSASRAVAAVTVANAAIVNLTVPAGGDSPLQTYPAAGGNNQLIIATQRTAQDGIRGIASFSLNWVNIAPQSVVWTGTSTMDGVVGGETKVAGTTLAQVGIGVTLVTDISGANLNKFHVHNATGTPAAINLLEVW